jgi:hypothetical protein
VTRSIFEFPFSRTVRMSAVLSLVAVAGLTGGCANTGAVDETASPKPIAPAAAAAPRAKIVLAPIIGPTPAIAKDLATQMTQSLERDRVTVVPAEPADYTLRGYVVATKEKERTKFSYIWDVMDPAGKRVNRITGDDTGLPAQGDVWTTATPAVLQSIATKASTSLVAWLPPSAPGQAPAAATAPAVPPPAAVGAQSPAATNQAVASSPVPTTASVTAQSKQVVVAQVAGAPGDGSQALSEALRRELSRSGLAVTQAATAATHKVEGKVILGKATKAPADKGGGEVQPIQIQWTVKDPKGESLGTVSQKNEIKPGELDGTWGPNADAVAAAAAQGIIKLIEKQTAVN